MNNSQPQLWRCIMLAVAIATAACQPALAQDTTLQITVQNRQFSPAELQAPPWPTQAEFIRVWQTSQTLREVCSRLKMKRPRVKLRAWRYRNWHGVPLKELDFDPAVESYPDWEELGTPDGPELPDLIGRARASDQDALPALRKLLDGRPELWEQAGDLCLQAERAYLNSRYDPFARTGPTPLPTR